MIITTMVKKKKKGIWRSPTPFMFLKKSQQTRNRGQLYQVGKECLKQLIANIIIVRHWVLCP